MRDDSFAAHAIVADDRIVIERDQLLGPNRIALVSIDGALRLVRVVRGGPRPAFDGMPERGGAPVQVIGVASRVIRLLVP